MNTFGPVPSRRLGRSLGINTLEGKVCPYSCVYCQLGSTHGACVRRREFHPPQELVAAVRRRVDACRAAGEPVDYLAFVPDGEPTLDVNLGRLIRDLRPLGLPIAVISNGALLRREDVRADLAAADWVSLKVDAARETTWRRINRPHGKLHLRSVLQGLHEFAHVYTGELTTETMLVAGVNDAPEEMRAVAALVAELAPARAYLAVPTRPPAERWVRPADEEAVARAYALLRQLRLRVELLVGYEGDAFAATGAARRDLLAVTGVHPMRESAVRRLLAKTGAEWTLVEGLLAEGSLVVVRYGGHDYYLRPIREPDNFGPRQ